MAEVEELESLISQLSLPEAPADGQAYGRQNNEWVVVATKLQLDEVAARIEQDSTVKDIGYIIVKNLEERNNLPTGTLIEGTEVYVNDLDVSYRWKNGTWVQLVSGTNNPIASADSLGLVKIGSHLLVDASGKISVEVIDEVLKGEKRPVSSGGVYSYVEGKIGDIDAVLSKI